MSSDLDVNGTINLTSGLYANGSAGTSGQVLTSSGGVAVTWAAPTAQTVTGYSVQASAPAGLPYISGGYTGGQYSTNSTTYVTKATYTIPSWITSGTMTASIYLNAIYGQPYAQLMVNGVQFGSELTTTATSYTLYSWGSVTIHAGDIIKFNIRTLSGTRNVNAPSIIGYAVSTAFSSPW